MSAPFSPPRIFLSYSHAEKPWCRSFAAHLRSVLGYADPGYIFFDESSLQSGDSWQDRLQQEIITRPIFIVVLTPNAVNSDYVRREVNLALQETNANRQRRILSVMLQPCDASQLAPQLMNYQMTDFVHQPFNIAFTALVGALRAINAEWMAHASAYPPQTSYPAYPAGQWGPPQQQPMPQALQTPLPYQPVANIPPAPASMMSPVPQPQSPLSSAPQPVQEQQVQIPQPTVSQQINELLLSVQATQQQIQSIQISHMPATGAAPTNTDMSPQLKRLIEEVNDSSYSERWGDVVRRAEFAISLGEPITDARFYQNLTYAYSGLQRWEQAIETGRKTASLDPFRPQLWQTIALAQQHLGLIQEALTSWDYAVAMLPMGTTNARRRELLKQRRDALSSQQLWDDVLFNCAEEMSDGGGDAEMLRVRAEVLMRLKLNDETVTPYLQQALPHSLRHLGYTITMIRGIEVIEPVLCDVPAGAFLMGSDPDVDPAANDDEQPQHSVTLPDYQIGRFPVTVAEYARFVRAGGNPPTTIQVSTISLDWAKQQEHPERPVVCVSWLDATAYAQWLADITGQPWRLPTEAEWEKAARWDATQNHARLYPWGDAWDEARCSTPAGMIFAPQVGMFASSASPYGAYDMEGSLQQWCSSTNKRYPYIAKDGREASQEAGGINYRVTRGYKSNPKLNRAATRIGYKMDYLEKGLGFRLVRGPAPVPVSAAAVVNTSSAIASSGGAPATAVTPLTPAQQLAQETHFAVRGGLWEEAVKKGEQAQQMPENATNEQLYTDLALAYGALQYWDASAGAASQAVRLNGFNADTWATLARAQRMLGQSNAALASFNRALALTPTENRQMQAKLLSEQRTLFMEQMRWQEALAVLDEELRLSPGNDQLLAARAELVRQLG